MTNTLKIRFNPHANKTTNPAYITPSWWNATVLDPSGKVIDEAQGHSLDTMIEWGRTHNAVELPAIQLPPPEMRLYLIERLCWWLSLWSWVLFGNS